jgi:RNA polymerase sigma factor (sigma-70 family)
MNQRGQFEQLLQSHRGIVYKVAGSYSRTASDRDDLAQEICLQLWRAFPNYDSQRKFSTWMYRVALNVAISHLRRMPQSDEPRFVPLDELHLETLADPISGRQQGELEVLWCGGISSPQRAAWRCSSASCASHGLPVANG